MTFTTRPLFRGRHGLVAAGHYLAAAAGNWILLEGGNAIDAAAAASFALVVLEPHLNGLAGEVPILIHSARENRPLAISGQGVAPAAATLERFAELKLDRVPGDGLLPATVPALVDAWIVALQHYGTRSLATVLAPAIELAEEGWPAPTGLARLLATQKQRFRREWPSTGAVFLQDAVPRPGGRVRNPDLARSLRRLTQAEEGERGSREDGLEAAHRAFYAGELAEVMAQHAQEHGGLLTLQDLRAYRGRVEEPVSVPYRDTVVHKCSTWTQGPVFLQQLRLLEGFDLAAMGQDSADYLHTWLEVDKLAFADREVYYGDPDFSAVPLDRLLSAEYAAERRALVDPQRSSGLLRPGGREPFAPADVRDIPGGGTIGEPSALWGDTTHVDAIDRWGNLVAATPSGGWISASPVVEGLGFPLGTRGQMFSLDPNHPNVLAPGKRPRATLTPSLAYRDGQPWMAFGTPGGDMQDQWTLQFFLNVVDFGFDLQAAIDAPSVHSLHAPSSFYPREARPRVVSAESRLPAETLEGLRERGHLVEVPGPWEHGRVQAVAVGEDGFLVGAASPRRETAYVMGW